MAGRMRVEFTVYGNDLTGLREEAVRVACDVSGLNVTHFDPSLADHIDLDLLVEPVEGTLIWPGAAVPLWAALVRFDF